MLNNVTLLLSALKTEKIAIHRIGRMNDNRSSIILPMMLSDANGKPAHYSLRLYMAMVPQNINRFGVDPKT